MDEDLVLLRSADGGNNWPSNAHLLLMVDSPDSEAPMPDMKEGSGSREE